MPLYVIERNYSEQLDINADGVKMIEAVNADAGVKWFFSFLTADRSQSYCLYEASSPEAILAAAKAANLPADVIVEVSRVVPEEVLAAAAPA
jgi:hypothetical protein